MEGIEGNGYGCQGKGGKGRGTEEGEKGEGGEERKVRTPLRQFLPTPLVGT